MIAHRRIPLFVLGAVSLLAGLLAGESRLGWELPDGVAALVALHGPLMICAFFGTVIGLERAVALDKAWGYAAPALTGVGGVTLILGAPFVVGAGLITAGSAVFAAMAADVVRRQTALFTIVMGLGAVAWFLGTTLWLVGKPVPVVVALWACFLVLTIAGERLELSRFLPPTPDRAVTAPIPLLLLLVAPVLVALELDVGGRVFGLGMLLLALWLVRHDIARRTVKQQGLTRYMAICLLSGYFWLGASGLMALVHGLPAGGPVYDAVLHALFVGFVFAMVFGHAPVILPAVLKVIVPFTNAFYLPLALLHASLLLRLTGDFTNAYEPRLWGGLLNAVAIVLFLLTTLVVTVAATRNRAVRRGKAA